MHTFFLARMQLPVVRFHSSTCIHSSIITGSTERERSSLASATNKLDPPSLPLSLPRRLPRFCLPALSIFLLPSHLIACKVFQKFSRVAAVSNAMDGCEQIEREREREGEAKEKKVGGCSEAVD